MLFGLGRDGGVRGGFPRARDALLGRIEVPGTEAYPCQAVRTEFERAVENGSPGIARLAATLFDGVGKALDPIGATRRRIDTEDEARMQIAGLANDLAGALPHEDMRKLVGLLTAYRNETRPIIDGKHRLLTHALAWLAEQPTSSPALRQVLGRLDYLFQTHPHLYLDLPKQQQPARAGDRHPLTLVEFHPRRAPVYEEVSDFTVVDGFNDGWIKKIRRERNGPRRMLDGDVLRQRERDFAGDAILLVRLFSPVGIDMVNPDNAPGRSKYLNPQSTTTIAITHQAQAATIMAASKAAPTAFRAACEATLKASDVFEVKPDRTGGVKVHYWGPSRTAEVVSDRLIPSTSEAACSLLIGRDLSVSSCSMLARTGMDRDRKLRGFPPEDSHSQHSRGAILLTATPYGLALTDRGALRPVIVREITPSGHTTYSVYSSVPQDIEERLAEGRPPTSGESHSVGPHL